jgi:hypothetical protein
LTETLKRLRLEGSMPTETARLPKRLRDSRGPRTYKEAPTNIKIAAFKEAYPEDKLTEDNVNNILQELGRVLLGTPKSYRLEGGALIYICARRATDNHRLGSEARLKATDARNFPKPVKVALRVRDKVVQTQDELLK